MPTKHIICSNCNGEFDYVMTAESYLVHGAGKYKDNHFTGAEDKNNKHKGVQQAPDKLPLLWSEGVVQSQNLTFYFTCHL